MGEDKWPRFAGGSTAQLTQPLPLAGTAQQPLTDFADDFPAERLRPEWTWNYLYSTPDIELIGGRLCLGGRPKEHIETGTALCVRATSPDFTLETALTDPNAGLSGLTMYGDDRNLVVWGIEGDKLTLKRHKGGKETLLDDSVGIGSQYPVYLRMEVRGCAPAKFGYSVDGREWNWLETHSAVSGDLLQWDRVARPGLYFEGPEGAFAEFEYFRMANR